MALPAPDEVKNSLKNAGIMLGLYLEEVYSKMC